jgi:hypothetical protein
MRRFWNVVRSRAGLVLGGGVLTVLLLPVTALAGGFSGNRGVYHQAGTGDGAISVSTTDLVFILGIAAAVVLFVAVAGRFGVRRPPVRARARGRTSAG